MTIQKFYNVQLDKQVNFYLFMASQFFIQVFQFINSQ